MRGYYSLADGRMASMPFNSSTAVMWYSKDAFRKAGLDPDKPPATWQEVVKAAQAIKAKDAAEIPVTSSWLSWIQLEQYSALHNIPFASKADGFEGLDAQLEINSKAHVKHMQRLLDMAKDGTFKYAGRDNQPDQLLLSGKAGIHFNSSGMRGDMVKSAKFDWGEAFLPYDPEIIKSPLNSIIGGASLWTMTAPGRTPAEYKAVATFLKFIGKPENDAYWHQHTGYVPVTLAGFELSQKQGFYEKNPGADLPVKQLTRGTVTSNSNGLRLGRLLEIRNIIYEEMEKGVPGRPDRAAGDGQRGDPRQQGAAGVREVGEDVMSTPSEGRPPPCGGAGEVAANRMERRTIFDGWLLPVVLVLPQLLLTAFFFLWPAGEAIWSSLTRAGPVRPRLHLRRPREFLRPVRRSALRRFHRPHA